MSDNTPRDGFDESGEDTFGFPGGEPEDLSEEERSFSFDEGYLDGDGSAPASDGPARSEEPAGETSAAPSAEPEIPASEPDGETPEEPGDEDPVDRLASAFRSRQEREMKARQDREEKVDALSAAFSRRTKTDKPAPAAPAASAEDGKNNGSGASGGFLAVLGSRLAAGRKSGADEDRSTAGLSPWQRRQMNLRRQPDPVTVDRELRPDEMLVYDSELDEIDYTDDEDLPEMRDYMPIRFRRYGRLGIGGGIMYALFVISVSIILACMMWMFAADVLALNKEPKSAIVTIDEYEPTGDAPVVNDEGDTIQVDIDQVASELKNKGMIEYKWLFKLFSRFSHAEAKIDPGTYDVSTELDYRALVTALQFGSGNQEITRVTFPEGYTLEQIFTLLEENHICHKNELYEASANFDFGYAMLDGLTMGDQNRLEGYLFPDTYDFYQGEDAAVAISRFLRNTDSKLTESVRNEASSRGLSVHELLTVASLIEKEAGSDEERATIASVIYNRLNAGMALGLDSTVNYITGRNALSVTIEETEIDDPYNTYLYTGLPPGPICNPGLASIQAALEPESTNYWYWYAYDGETYFFTDFDEHQAFVNAHPNE